MACLESHNLGSSVELDPFNVALCIYLSSDIGLSVVRNLNSQRTIRLNLLFILIIQLQTNSTVNRHLVIFQGGLVVCESSLNAILNISFGFCVNTCAQRNTEINISCGLESRSGSGGQLACVIQLSSKLSGILLSLPPILL